MRRGSAKYGTGPVPGGSGGPGDPPDPPVDPEFTILSGGNPGQLYVLAYAYDLNGRRISLSYPSLLRPYSRAAAEYLYTDWGALEAIRGLAGEWYSFGYDEESRLTSIVYPQDTGLTESFVYDSDGRRIIRKLGTAAMPGSVYDDSLVYDWRGKVTKAFLRASSRVVENWYDGLGRVVASSWQSTISGDLNVDQFRTDPYGNIAWSRKRDGFGNAPEYENHYDPYGRITLVQLAPTSPNPSTWSHEWREYDAAGNVSFAAEVRFGPGQMEPTTEVHRRTTRYYYSADKRLVYSQRFARDPIDMGGDSDDLFEEIRYDALGRRILVRTQHAPFGAVGKSDAITRFVWDGDQLLGELRASGDQLEATFGTGRQYGRVTYLHGGEIDKPLGVYRNDFSNAVGPTLIVPYVNWRGQHERGTFVGGAPECTGSHSDCIHVEWPAPKMRTYLDGQAPGEGDWVGSLLQDQLDESGLLYRRNRYYDPNTGQFTQEDPIGIAGGLNLYGFADGDPLSHSDPFGLWCEKRGSGNGERLYCEDIGPGDFYTIRDYLGGAAGESAFHTFQQAGFTKWSPSTCVGGFSDSQCTMLAQSFSKLTLHADSRCSSLGVSATKRFQAGRFRYKDLPDNLLGYAQKFWPWGTITLDPDAFATPQILTTIVAHEARHFQNPFAGGGPLGIFHRYGDSVYRIGEYCGQ